MRAALSADELTILRSELHGTRLYLGVHKPASIFTALVAGAVAYPTFQIPYDTGSPAAGAIIKSGMTVWIGSAAGLRDKGQMRVRGDQTAAASGNLAVAELGRYAIDIDDNDFLTVVEDYRIAAKFPRYSGGAWLMDYDVAWSGVGAGNNVKPNQEYGPLARLGPAAVGFLETNLCRLRYVGERSAAYSPSNTIGTYAWTFPGTASPATSAAQGTTASPILIDYSAAIPGGRYHGLTVTENTTTKTHVGRRLTFVFERTGSNAPYDAEVIGAISGGPEQGGYTVSVRVINTTADQDDFPDGAHVVLFEEALYADDAGSGNIDRYFYLDDRTLSFTVSETVTGGTTGTTGTVISASNTLIKIRSTKAFHTQEIITGGTSGATARLRSPSVGGNYPYRCDVVLEGWIVDETVHKDPETGDIEFEVVTVDGVMRGEEGYPVALTNRTNTTKLLTWEDFYRMTLDNVLLHFVKWRSTIGDVVDVTLHSDLVGSSPANVYEVIKYCDMDQGNLFDQVNTWYARTMLGWVSSDLQSGLYGELDAQIDDTTRAGIPTAWTVAAGDRAGTLEIGRRAHRKSNSQVTLYAVDYRTPIGSRSPDDPHDYEGGLEEITEGIAAPDQATLNLWAGNLRAKRNNVYPAVDHRWANYWRVDPVPQSYIVESLIAGDTVRGIVWSSFKLIPRSLTLEWREGMLLASNDCEGETQGLGGATITFPPVSDPPASESPPPEEPGRPPDFVSDASEIMFLVRETSSIGSTPHLFWSGDFFNGGQPTYLEITKPAGVTQVRVFQALQDGSIAYVQDEATGDIWKTTDVGNASPTWTLILDVGTTTAFGDTITASGALRAIGGRIYVMIRTGDTHYGKGYYTGSAWVWLETTRLGNLDFSEPTFSDHHYRYGTNPIQLRLDDGDTLVDDYNNVALNHSSWRSHDGGDIKRITENNAAWYIRNATTSTNIYTAGGALTGTLKGALHGDQICFTDSAGEATIADDGATFEVRATWQQGTILPAQLAGGDTLVWLVTQTAANNVFARLSYDGFDTAGTDMSGNFWTELYAGQFNLGDVCLIFR